MTYDSPFWAIEREGISEVANRKEEGLLTHGPQWFMVDPRIMKRRIFLYLQFTFACFWFLLPFDFFGFLQQIFPLPALPGHFLLQGWNIPCVVFTALTTIDEEEFLDRLKLGFKIEK